MSTNLTMAQPLDVESALASAREQVRRLITTQPGRIPVFTEHGRWKFDADPWAPTWTGGFLTGLIWIFAERSGDPWWREQAEAYCRLLEPRAADESTHDIGFLFTPSWGRWYQVHPAEPIRDVLILAGRTMASRFNQVGGYLDTWVDPGSTFIDVMMNVGIIYQAAELSGDSDLAAVATRHALTSRRFLVRGDASTIHEGWFDPANGQFLRAATHQGWRPDSSWARGLSWGVYGFGTAYAATGDERFLDTARRLADFYIERTGDRFVPPNDWDEPEPAVPYEASAACIAASGLLQLADLIGPEGSRFSEYSVGILTRLAGPEFLSDPDSDYEGIIRHATYHTRNGLGVDESVMWGDYYFVEALDRLHPKLRPAR